MIKKHISLFFIYILLLLTTVNPFNVYADDSISFTWPSDDIKINNNSEQKYEPIASKDHIELAYIESSNTQYINLGVTANIISKASIKGSLETTSGITTTLFGVFEDSKYLLHFSRDQNNSVGFFCRIGEIGSYSSYRKMTSYTSGSIVTFDYDAANNVANINGERHTGALGSGQPNPQSLTSSQKFMLFGMGENGLDSAGQQCKGRIYYCKLGNTSLTSIVDLIPVLTLREIDSSKVANGSNNIPANTACMYDKNTGNYYVNNGTGDFIAGPPIKTLGDGNKYGLLEYIESTGTQYINTGYKPNDKSQIFIDVAITGHYGSNPTYGQNYTSFFGSRGGNHANDSFVACRNNGANAIRVEIGNSVYQSFDYQNNVKMSLEFNSKYVEADGTSYPIASAPFSQSNFPIYLFGINQNNGLDTGWGTMTQKIYYSKIEEEGSKIREFIPVLRQSDAKPGLYDLASNTFYANATSSGNDFKYGVSTNFYSLKEVSSDTYKATVAGEYNSIVELTDLGKQFFSESNLSHTWSIQNNKYVSPVHNTTVSYNGQPHTVSVDSVIKNQVGTDVTANASLKFSNDNGSTYTLDTPPTYTEKGTYTIYFQISHPTGDTAYDTLTSTATLKIQEPSPYRIPIPNTGIK